MIVRIVALALFALWLALVQIVLEQYAWETRPGRLVPVSDVLPDAAGDLRFPTVDARPAGWLSLGRALSPEVGLIWHVARPLATVRAAFTASRDLAVALGEGAIDGPDARRAWRVLHRRGEARPGDVVLAVDGAPVKGGEWPSGRHALSVRRGGRALKYTAPLGSKDVAPDVVTATGEPWVRAAAPEELGGPSAGLAMALAAAGVDPAGCVVVTGALDFDGRVLRVGGLAQKVSATAEGRCRFVYPRAERDQAQAAAKRLGVALDAQAVASFAEALAALGGAGRGGGPLRGGQAGDAAAGGLH